MDEEGDKHEIKQETPPKDSQIGITQAYRTVSTAVALVLAEKTPWNLEVKKRKRLWDEKGEMPEINEAERNVTIAVWQDEGQPPHGAVQAHMSGTSFRRPDMVE